MLALLTTAELCKESIQEKLCQQAVDGFRAEDNNLVAHRKRSFSGGTHGKTLAVEKCCRSLKDSHCLLFSLHCDQRDPTGQAGRRASSTGSGGAPLAGRSFIDVSSLQQLAQHCNAQVMSAFCKLERADKSKGEARLQGPHMLLSSNIFALATHQQWMIKEAQYA